MFMFTIRKTFLYQDPFLQNYLRSLNLKFNNDYYSKMVKKLEIYLRIKYCINIVLKILI